MSKAAVMTRGQMAQRELARRELARRSLIDFCCYVDPEAARDGALDPFLDNRYRAEHLVLIANTIERAMTGSLFENIPGSGQRILIVTTPPGHWKSSLISRKLPAWFIGREQRAGRPHQVILTSYNAKLATSNNRANLDLVRDNGRYAAVFPGVELSRRSQSSEEWSLAGEPHPASVAAGVGGGLTGNHADLVIVDDPIKDRAQANSPAYIAQLWSWWTDVLRTRVNPGGFILGVWTRWSENDPAGKLMAGLKAGQSQERVYMLRLPALAETQAEREAGGAMGLPVDVADPLGREPGEALWPEQESAAAHRATRLLSPLTFDSLGQGRPRPTGGFIIGRDTFQPLGVRPVKDVRWCLGTDWAITEKERSPKRGDPDYTAAALVGIWRPGGSGGIRLVIASIVRGQHGQARARELVKDQMLAAGSRVPMRSGQANMDRLYLSNLRGDPDLVGFSIKNLSKKILAGDKVTKATPWLELAEAGMVYLVGGEWVDDFTNEVEQFPHGAHDDMIDAVSIAVHALGLGQRSRKVKSEIIKGFGR